VPKNIILLSDGTGNSPRNPFKTNVWRLYQAIDRSAPNQVVFYTDGVGTENFKPLKLLGLTLGVGVASNVKELYAFLCRNYEPGDGVFLFGFSRGAFTVRVLAGLIVKCGVIFEPNSEQEIQTWTEAAYTAYKRDVARRAKSRALFSAVGVGPYAEGLATEWIKIDGFEQVFPTISFVGVWDTVDAYGMPMDGLKVAIDKLIWPMTFADRKFSPYVERACHALALDDERATFRPVLWTESDTEHKRLLQIWFAGAHANIGGGYPDDGLAYVSLHWMMDEAEASGLRLNAADRSRVKDRADPHGVQYDSRSGIAGYYRYKPRMVDDLCKDRRHGVLVVKPKVHASVMERIAEARAAYAPIGFPNISYVVFGPTGTHPLDEIPSIELPDQIVERFSDMRDVWALVCQRRITYLATLVLTVFLVAIPLLDRLDLQYDSSLQGHVVGQGTAIVLRKIFGAVAAVFPWTLTWLEPFANHSVAFLVALTLLLWLFVRKSSQLQTKILYGAERAWHRVWQ
jgi:uncharacterized protein (DUF2235 family)